MSVTIETPDSAHDQLLELDQVDLGGLGGAAVADGRQEVEGSAANFNLHCVTKLFKT